MSWPALGRDLRRSMPFVRPLLMGEAHVAVGDQPSVLFFNPAGLAGREETTVDAFSPQLNVNDEVMLALLDSEKFEQKVDQLEQDIDNGNYEAVLGRAFFADLNLRAPFIVMPRRHMAVGFGIEGMANLVVAKNRVIPRMRVEFFFDKMIFMGGFGNIGPDFSVGANLKLINRIGVDRTYTAGEFLIGDTSTDSITDRKEWQDVKDGRSFTALGADLGVIYRLPFARAWEPRIGLSLLNIGGYDKALGLTGMEFGPRKTPYEPPQAGTLPQINTIGMALSHKWQAAMLTFALDLVDFSRTVLPGDNFRKRLRTGLDLGIAPRLDGTPRLSLFYGLNGGHRSYGLLTRVFFLEIGFGVYTVELGDTFGDFPDERTVFLMGIQF